MRRLVLALAVLLTASATPTFAGYIIIRVLLEGGGAGDDVPGGSGGVIAPPSTPGPRGGRGGDGPQPGGPPGMGAPGATKSEPDPTRSIVVVVPIETDFVRKNLEPKFQFHPDHNPAYLRFEVPVYGQRVSEKSPERFHASLFVDSSTIQLYDSLLNTPVAKKSFRSQIHDAHQAWLTKKDNPRLLYDALVLALRHGFVKDAAAYADELVAVGDEKKVALPERDVKPFVTLWAGARKAVTGTAPKPGDANNWRDRLGSLGYQNVRTLGHYSVVYADSPLEEVDRRAAQLNDNFTAFFLWHALNGHVPTVPDKPLTVLLAPQGKVMRELNRTLDGLPMADGFYAPDHGLLVLSPERLDDVGQTFLTQNQQVFVKGLNREQLLKGQIPKLDATEVNGQKPDLVARASTLAAVERLAVMEAELAAVSREGTRQLMYATGVLPKHVTLPTWLSNGAVNYFARPRGPAYVTVGDDEKPNMHVALTTGYGGSNFVLLRYFRDLASKKELPPVGQKFDPYAVDTVRLLENVLGDVYFTGIKNGDDPDPAPPKKPKKAAGTDPMPMTPMPMNPPVPGQPPLPAGDQEDPVEALRKKQQRLAIKANATSWALYEYLATYKADQLRQYIAELNKFPRDLPIDGRTAHDVFVRVFKLANEKDGTASPAELKKFADAWYDYVSTLSPAGHDIPLTVPEPPKMPMGGTNPMGTPGSGGRP